MLNNINMEVEIVSEKLLTPSPTRIIDHPRKVRLSCIDQLAPPVYVCCVFYYENDRETSGDDVLVEERVARMEESLAETLTVFYPLAGRYVEEDLSVDCNDEGIGFFEARVKAEMEELLRLEQPDGKLLAKLVPSYHERHSATAPLMSVQVNVFECGGIAIGVQISHLVADGYSISLFINAWATACRLGKIDQIARPSFDLSPIFPSRDIFAGSKYKPAGEPPSSGSHVNLVTTRFVFDGEAISRLRVVADHGAASRVQLVTALVWRALLRASQARREDNKPRASLVSHALGMRGKTSLPVADRCFGNLWRLALARFTPSDEAEGVGFRELAGLVRDAIRGAAAESGEPSVDGDGVFLMARDAWCDMVEARARGEDDMDVYDFSSWCKMGHYEADFGWGRLCWISMVHVPVDGLVVFSDTRSGDGVEVWVSLAEDKMVAFERDGDVVARGVRFGPENDPRWVSLDEDKMVAFEQDGDVFARGVRFGPEIDQKWESLDEDKMVAFEQDDDIVARGVCFGPEIDPNWESLAEDKMVAFDQDGDVVARGVRFGPEIDPKWVSLDEDKIIAFDQDENVVNRGVRFGPEIDPKWVSLAEDKIIAFNQGEDVVVRGVRFGPEINPKWESLDEDKMIVFEQDEDIVARGVHFGPKIDPKWVSLAEDKMIAYDQDEDIVAGGVRFGLEIDPKWGA